MRRLAVCAALALILTACGEGDLKAGAVTGRSHEAAHDETVMMPHYMTTCSGKPVMCRQQLIGFFPITTHYPECWRVDFHDGERKGHACTTHRRWLGTVQGQGWAP